MKVKNIIGYIGVALAIVLGLYVGVWLCFIGGIIGIFQSIQMMIDGTGIDAMLIGWSIVKMLFAGLAGYLSGVVILLPSLALLGHTPKKKRRF